MVITGIFCPVVSHYVDKIKAFFCFVCQHNAPGSQSGRQKQIVIVKLFAQPCKHFAVGAPHMGQTRIFPVKVNSAEPILLTYIYKIFIKYVKIIVDCINRIIVGVFSVFFFRICNTAPNSNVSVADYLFKRLCFRFQHIAVVFKSALFSKAYGADYYGISNNVKVLRKILVVYSVLKICASFADRKVGVDNEIIAFSFFCVKRFDLRYFYFFVVFRRVNSQYQAGNFSAFKGAV